MEKTFLIIQLKVGIPIGITRSKKGLKICVVAAGIKKHRSINKKNKRNLK